MPDDPQHKTAKRVGSPAARAELVLWLRAARRFARRVGAPIRLRPGGVATMLRVLDATREVEHVNR